MHEDKHKTLKNMTKHVDVSYIHYYPKKSCFYLEEVNLSQAAWLGSVINPQIRIRYAKKRKTPGLLSIYHQMHHKSSTVSVSISHEFRKLKDIYD